MARILLVDDDDLIRETLTKALTDAGYEIVAARSGRIGLRHLHDAPFDVLVTDVLMPDVDGIETIRQARESDPDLHIIAISGGGVLPKSEYLRMAKKLGATHALAKPFHAGELVALIRTCLGE